MGSEMCIRDRLQPGDSRDVVVDVFRLFVERLIFGGDVRAEVLWDVFYEADRFGKERKHDQIYFVGADLDNGVIYSNFPPTSPALYLLALRGWWWEWSWDTPRRRKRNRAEELVEVVGNVVPMRRSDISFEFATPEFRRYSSEAVREAMLGELDGEVVVLECEEPVLIPIQSVLTLSTKLPEPPFSLPTPSSISTLIDKEIGEDELLIHAPSRVIISGCRAVKFWDWVKVVKLLEFGFLFIPCFCFDPFVSDGLYEWEEMRKLVIKLSGG